MVDRTPGHYLTIDGHEIYVNPTKYAEEIVVGLTDGWYEGRERTLVKSALTAKDRVIEIGTAIGLVALTAASIVGPENIITFEANAEILADARENFARNKMSGIVSKVGVLKCQECISSPGELVDFHINRAFWASRLSAKRSEEGITRIEKVPVFCLEDEINHFGATAIICDIEGGEVDLFLQANLEGVRLIIMEVHPWEAGYDATQSMMEKLHADGFVVDRQISQKDDVLVFNRPTLLA